MIDVPMAYGSHHRIAQSIGDVEVSVMGREVELLASILPDPMLPDPSHLMPTTIWIERLP